MMATNCRPRFRSKSSPSMSAGQPGEHFLNRWRTVSGSLTSASFLACGAEGDTPRVPRLENVAEVAHQWVLMKIADKDGDLPILNGVDLNRI